MEAIYTQKGVIIMADNMDFTLWKAQKVWELAMSVIPKKPEQTGAWTESNYLKKSQEELEKARAIVATVFTFEKLN